MPTKKRKKPVPKPKLTIVKVALTEKYGVRADKSVWRSWHTIKARNEDSIRTHDEFVTHRHAIRFICGVKATSKISGWMGQCLADGSFCDG